MVRCGGKLTLFLPVQVGEGGIQRSHSAGGGNGPSDCRLPTLSAIEGSPVEGGLGEGGGGGCSGISTALGIQARQRRLSNPLSPTL